MSTSLGVTTLESGITSRDKFASNHPALQKTNITIGAAADLVAGTCLGIKTADGKYYKWNQSASDGTQTLAGVLGCDAPAAEEDVKAFCYVTGHFLADALVATSTISIGFYNNDNVALMLSEEEE